MKLTKLSIVTIILFILLSIGAVNAVDISDDVLDLNVGYSDDDLAIDYISVDSDSSYSSAGSNLDYSSVSADSGCSSVGSDSDSGFLSSNLDSNSNLTNHLENAELSSSKLYASSTYIIDDNNYANYFNTNFNSSNYADAGKLLSNTTIKNGDIIKIANVTDKFFVFDKNLTITSNNTGDIITNGFIKLIAGSSGSTICNLTINNSYVNYKNISSYHNKINLNGIQLVDSWYNKIYNNYVLTSEEREVCALPMTNSSYNNIFNNSLTSGRSTAIPMSGCSYNNFTNNYLSSVDANIIYYSPWSTGTFELADNQECNYNRIINNTFNGNNGSSSAWCYALQLIASSSSSHSGVVIANNTIYNAYRGISFAMNDVLIENNTIFNIGMNATTSYNPSGITVDNFVSDNASSVIIRNNYIDLRNSSVAVGVYIPLKADTYFTIENNTIITTNGSAMNISSNKNNISNNNITTESAYGIFIYGSNNIIEFNNINVKDNNSNTDIAAIKLYSLNKVEVSSNQILNNTIFTNTSYGIILQGNITNTLIKGNIITTNSSKPIEQKTYTTKIKIAPQNTTSIDNVFIYPVHRIIVNDKTYSNYFDDVGTLLDEVFPDDQYDILVIIENVTNKNFVFTEKVIIDGYGVGSIINGSISFKEGSDGSAVQNLIMNYADVGLNDFSFIDIAPGVSNFTIDNNMFTIDANTSLENPVVGINFEGDSDYLSENIVISNNIFNITANYNEKDFNSIISAINFENPSDESIVMERLNILNNVFNIEALNVYGLEAINLKSINNASIVSNTFNILAAGADEDMASDIYALYSSNCGNLEFLNNDLNVSSNQMAYGLSIFQSENINIKGNDILVCGTGAIGLGFLGDGTSLNNNSITDNFINISGGNYSSSITNNPSGVANDAIFIKDINNITVTSNIIVSNDIGPINVTNSINKLIYSNSFVITDDNILNYFTNRSNGVLRDGSTVKEGDSLLFALTTVGDDGRNGFIFNISLNVKSFSEEFILNNTRFILNDGASDSNLTGLKFKNVDGSFAIVLNQSSNVSIRDSTIEISPKDAGASTLIAINVIGGGNNTISNNEIIMYNTSQALNPYYYGIYVNNFDINMDIFGSSFTNSSNNTVIKDNEIIVDSPYFANGIYLSQALNTLIEDNNLNINGSEVYGIYNEFASWDGSQNNTMIYNNTVDAFGDNVCLIFSDSAINTSIVDNVLRGNGGLVYGYKALSVLDDNLSSNYIRVGGSDTSNVLAGVYFTGLSYGVYVLNNYIVSDYESGGDYGVVIFIDDNSKDMLVSNNYILSDNGGKKGNSAVYTNVTLDFMDALDIVISYNSPYDDVIVKLVSEFVFANVTSITYLNSTNITGELFNVSLTDLNGVLLVNKTVEFQFEGQTYNVTTDNDGIAQIPISFDYGFNGSISFNFAGDNYYESTNGVALINIAKKSTVIKCSNMTTTAIYTARTGKYFVANLTDSDGNVLANKSVAIGFNGATYNRTTDENGSFRLQVNLKVAGGYTFAIAFLGDDNYNGSFAVAKITVNKAKTKLTNVKSKYTYKSAAKTKSLQAKLSLSNGTVVSGKKITFAVNGKTYSATTNSKGIATVKVSITAKKTYKYTVKFATTTQLAASSVTGTLVIT